MDPIFCTFLFRLMLKLYLCVYGSLQVFAVSASLLFGDSWPVVWVNSGGLKVLKVHVSGKDGHKWWSSGLVISMTAVDTMDHSYPLFLDSVPDSDSSVTGLSPEGCKKE